MFIGGPEVHWRTRCASESRNSSMWLTGRGAYMSVYQVVVDNRVRKNAHTNIGNGLSIRTISATVLSLRLWVRSLKGAVMYAFESQLIMRSDPLGIEGDQFA